jgi:hypothetical protein
MTQFRILVGSIVTDHIALAVGTHESLLDVPEIAGPGDELIRYVSLQP